MTALICRFCATPLEHSFVDLGASPLANSYVPPEAVLAMEPFYALHAYVCHACWLVQLPAVERREAIFNAEYAYFSSYSESVLAHSRAYVEMMVERFGFDARHQVVEIASNDGYLLQYFRDRGRAGARHRALGERRRGGDRRRHPEPGALLRGRDRAGARPPRVFGPTCCSATTCWRTCPTSTTSSAA